MNEQERYINRRNKLKAKLHMKELNGLNTLLNKKLEEDKLYIENGREYKTIKIQGTQEEFEKMYSKDFLDKQIELGNIKKI